MRKEKVGKNKDAKKLKKMEISDIENEKVSKDKDVKGKVKKGMRNIRN